MAGAGRLLGVGVGPGDPELVTLKAARAIAQAPVVAFFAKRGRPGNARTIAAPHMAAGVTELRLDYPFTTEVATDDGRYGRDMAAFYDDCSRQIAAHLDAGRDVAALCEGDPLFYGSYMYVHDRLRGVYDWEVIPGVTGMSGCWSRAGAPMTRVDDSLSVLSGTMSEDALAARLSACDAAVIMKLGRNFPKVRAALARAGLSERAIFVSRGTMDDEEIIPLHLKGDDEAPYFSMILVPTVRPGR